MNEELLVGHFW